MNILHLYQHFLILYQRFKLRNIFVIPLMAVFCNLIFQSWKITKPVGQLEAFLRINKYPPEHPVNSFQYKYVLEENERCDMPFNNVGINLMLIVISKVSNFRHREAVRTTWGKSGSFHGNNVRTVFMLGSNTVSARSKSYTENKYTNDIIQGDFYEGQEDSSTHKMIMALEWVQDHCNNVDYYMFVDDSHLVSVNNVFRFLRNPDRYPMNTGDLVDPKENSDEDLWAGFVMKDSRPRKYLFHPRYVTYDEYPYDKYPTYVSTGAFIVSQKSFLKLYLAYLYTDFFKFDDVYLGMCAVKANITPTHNDEFVKEKRYSHQDYKHIIASDGFVKPNEMTGLWRKGLEWWQ